MNVALTGVLEGNRGNMKLILRRSDEEDQEKPMVLDRSLGGPLPQGGGTGAGYCRPIPAGLWEGNGA